MNRPFHTIALTPLRRIIAARMTDAKQTIPHYRVSVDIEMDDLLALRQRINEENPELGISVNDYILKACALVLMKVPELNSQWFENEIHQYTQADIAFVVAVPGGLTTPVVCGADMKTLQEIARETRALSERAAAGQLKMREITGGSFSISNLGMYGVDQFDAIINPPQCAILAVGAAKPQAVVKNSEVKTATMMRASLSLDHRALDGAVGAEFLSVLRELLQNPASIVSPDSDTTADNQ